VVGSYEPLSPPEGTLGWDGKEASWNLAMKRGIPLLPRVEPGYPLFDLRFLTKKILRSKQNFLATFLCAVQKVVTELDEMVFVVFEEPLLHSF
jgi:hypothetical protein